jgi:hypothetical protein
MEELKEEVNETKEETAVKPAEIDAGRELTSSMFGSLGQLKTVFDMGKMLATSQLVPAAYAGKPMDCAIAIDIANRLNVPPLFVLQNLYVVKGRPSWSGQACIAILNNKFSSIKFNFTGEKGTDTRGCYVTAKGKDGAELTGAEVNIAMAKGEGWFGKDGSKWRTMPEQMLMYRSASFFARTYAPNELMGFRVEGEAEDMEKSEEKSTVDPFDKGGNV